MKIFAQEIEDGLEEKLKTSASISYASVAEPCDSDSTIKHIKSIASINDNDLYYVQSILVSSSWNKNDDIFDKNEVWEARNTPEDKPTNLEHDENTIIGHITSNWPITEDGILIDENTPLENIPEKFHILTGSVIYKSFSNPELKARSAQLIEEIESGQKFVSMECYFKNFDYGIIDKTSGSYKVLERNEDTSYLTKFLRAYGGMGEHENYKIGRVLRNITFSGKGFVNKPANPDSIIFSKNMIVDDNNKNITEKTSNLTNAGVFNNQSNPNVENNTMNLEQQIADLAEKVALFADASALKEKTVELENTIKAQEVALTEAQAAIEVANSEKELAAKKMEDEMKKKDEEMSKVKSELDSANEVIAGYMQKEQEMMKKEKKMKRMASLIEAGLDNEAASATADKFESLDDEAFTAMTTLFAAKMPPWLEKKKKDEEAKPKASEVVNTEEALENAEADTDLNLSVSSDEDSQIESTRAALVEFVCARLGKKLNKGE
jgi:hypothetical protein